jgi:hypothetical protein
MQGSGQHTLPGSLPKKLQKNTVDSYGENPIFQKNRHQENVLRGGGHVHQKAAGEDD